MFIFWLMVLRRKWWTSHACITASVMILLETYWNWWSSIYKRSNTRRGGWSWAQGSRILHDMTSPPLGLSLLFFCLGVCRQGKGIGMLFLCVRQRRMDRGTERERERACEEEGVGVPQCCVPEEATCFQCWMMRHEKGKVMLLVYLLLLLIVSFSSSSYFVFGLCACS